MNEVVVVDLSFEGRATRRTSVERLDSGVGDRHDPRISDAHVVQLPRSIGKHCHTCSILDIGFKQAYKEQYCPGVPTILH